MRRRRFNLSLLIAFALSAAAHVMVLGPAMVGMMTVRGQAQAAHALNDAQDQDAHEPPLPEEDQVNLGIDAKTPSSLTWVGYEEYQKHLAALAEIEQAAFTDDPVAASPLPPPPSPEMMQATAGTTPAESPQPREAVESQLASVAPEPQPEASATSTPPQPQPPALVEQSVALRSWIESAGLSPSLEGPSREQAQRASTPAEQPEEHDPLAWLKQTLEAANETGASENARRQTIDDSSQRSPSEDKSQSSQSASAHAAAESAKPSATPASPATTPDRPVSRTPQPGLPSDGAHTDKESDATSVIDVPRDQWMFGKPLAAHGLELRPQRPQYTILTSLTASPGNPLCQINFDRHGVPQTAAILESSGDSRVDAGLLAALYRWRASGERLNELGEGQTISVKIRILFNNRKRK